MRDGVSELIGKLASQLTRLGYFLSTAESCTGGMIAARCTDVAGSSAWFKGGIVAYANEMKEKFLAVPCGVLAEYGAVSEPVVIAMALGALSACETQAAIAVSGIAGPGGGTKDKPVGTVWIAAVIMDKNGFCCPPECVRVSMGQKGALLLVRGYHFTGSRAAIRKQACGTGLSHLSTLVDAASGQIGPLSET
ncbi:hypothetical protein FACS1894206_06850 [Deltaproteobacteria bacterium]|nr:hypothetical protein FACS1894206_06850 [Deltaproteobacteria bacterium]